MPLVRDLNTVSGLYTLKASSDKTLICDFPVHVVWITHQSQPLPFLGLKVPEPEEFRQALAAYVGKSVALEFIPRRADSKN
jgi:hypothetical protein